MVISWGLVCIYYRIVSCSGTAHLSGPFFFFFSFRMTTVCLSWLERSTAHKVIYFYTCKRYPTPGDALPACPTPFTFHPSSPSWWRHSILPPLALAPLALSHRSAAGLTGSDVCQRLFFISQALEVRAVTEKGFSQVKYDLCIEQSTWGEKC